MITNGKKDQKKKEKLGKQLLISALFQTIFQVIWPGFLISQISYWDGLVLILALIKLEFSNLTSAFEFQFF